MRSFDWLSVCAFGLKLQTMKVKYEAAILKNDLIIITKQS
jgi:hypothetical protein